MNRLLLRAILATSHTVLRRSFTSKFNSSVIFNVSDERVSNMSVSGVFNKNDGYFTLAKSRPT